MIPAAGNHDNRNYEDDWGERYDGLVSNSDYSAQANENYAKNLKGKLLLAHGLMDDNVPPENTLLVVQALERANLSGRNWGAQAAAPIEFSPYMMRRRWDYFVKNLLGATPPHEYELKATRDPRTGGR